MLIPERGWLQNYQRLVTGGAFYPPTPVVFVKKSVIFSCFFQVAVREMEWFSGLEGQFAYHNFDVFSGLPL